MFGKCLLLGLSLTGSALLAPAQRASPGFVYQMELGRLANGAMVTFIRAGSMDFGIEISGDTAPRFAQQKPAQIEVSADEEIMRQLAVGYHSLKREWRRGCGNGEVAGAGQAVFAVEDRWKISGKVLSLRRKVSVASVEGNAVFYSVVRLVTAPSVRWEDGTCFIPGLLYGDSSHAGGGSFPQSWQTGTTTPREPSGAMTGAPFLTLVKLNQETGQKKYLDTAIKAADYLWTTYGSKGVYCSATGDAAIADKESGMLALEALLAVYDATKDPKWLQRAESAASYTESWIWNVPMPLDVSIGPTGQIGEVKGTDPLDLNTITHREKVVAIMSNVDGLGTDFTRTFAPYSANVLVLKGK